MQALLMQYVTDVVVGMQAWSNMLMVSIGLGGFNAVANPFLWA